MRSKYGISTSILLIVNDEMEIYDNTKIRHIYKYIIRLISKKYEIYTFNFYGQYTFFVAKIVLTIYIFL